MSLSFRFSISSCGHRREAPRHLALAIENPFRPRGYSPEALYRRPRPNGGCRKHEVRQRRVAACICVNRRSTSPALAVAARLAEIALADCLTIRAAKRCLLWPGFRATVFSDLDVVRGRARLRSRFGASGLGPRGQNGGFKEPATFYIPAGLEPAKPTSVLRNAVVSGAFAA
jgi:hypothetical protein